MKSSHLSRLQFRPQLQAFEDRAVPAATFFSEEAIPDNPAGDNRYHGVVITTATLPAAPAVGTNFFSIYDQAKPTITLIDTNGDAHTDKGSYEQATFAFNDTLGDTNKGYVVAILVYKLPDDGPQSKLPTTRGGTDGYISPNQELAGYQTVSLAGTGNNSLTVLLPSCNYQLDVLVVTPDELAASVNQTPPHFLLTGTHTIVGGLGSNFCGGDRSPRDGDPRTQGYWKTHGPIPTGNNSNEWPVQSLTLGSKTYDAMDLLRILNTPVRGNGAIALAHQLIAAKLNVAAGANGSAAMAADIAAADALIGSGDLLNVFHLLPSVTSALTSTLDAFNNYS